MPKYSYPGVYVNEVPSGDRSVPGVSTSITAFVGFTARGKLNEATRVLSFGDFEKLFGGLHAESDLSYAIRQYFLNGGTEAVVVRTASGAQAASVVLKNAVTSGAPVLEIRAQSEGAWGNALRVTVDYATPNPDSFFNLTVAEYPDGATAPVNQELFRSLSMNPGSANFAPAVINASSKLIRATNKADLAALAAVAGFSASAELPVADAATDTITLTDGARFLKVAINGEGPYEVALLPAPGAGGAPKKLAEIADLIEAALKGASGKPAFKDVSVTVEGKRLVIHSGAPGATSAVVVTPAATSDASKLLKLGLANGGSEVEAAAQIVPAATGTVSQDLAFGALALSEEEQTTITLTYGETTVFTGTVALGSRPANLTQLAAALQAQIRSTYATNPRLKNLTVRAVGNRLVAVASAEAGAIRLGLQDAAGQTLGAKLQMADSNVQWYALGSPVSVGAQGAGPAGADGEPAATAAGILGSAAQKTGLYALENTDLFNLLCIPEMANFPATEHAQIMADAMAYCDRRRAFLLVDAPATITTPGQMEAFMRDVPRHKNAAVYWPQIQVADPLNGFRLRAVAPSGTVAGVYARTDSTRGIWKVPAGVDAAMTGVQALSYNLTDAENGILNELGCNCLRNFPVYGKVIWGARTLTGADEMVSEWKYVAVRRTSLYIEESLFRGTKWAVFEPNDEPLWSQVRLSINAFMNRLYRQGAFPGSPKDAYFVQCDAGTTTRDDVNQGVVNIMVGFAPLKPAEFVVLNLQQIAGQAQG